MPVHGEWISYGGRSAFLAWPQRASRPLPSVVVVQEIWGVEDQIEDVTRRIAGAGYVAMAPDLFASGMGRPEALTAVRIEQARTWSQSAPPGAMWDPAQRDTGLAAVNEPTRSEILATLVAIGATFGQQTEFVTALRQAVSHLKQRPESRDQKVGCVGFCMGGGLASLLSCEEPGLDAAAVFYGNAPAPEAVARGRCPVIGFYGGNDERINSGISGFASSMAAAGRSFESHVYPGTNHAFFNETGPSYDADASRDSFVRLLTFFRDHLVP
jgi:carboxymethylenebutenolidase